MKWKLITIDKPALPWTAGAVTEYLKRIKAVTPVEWTVVKETGSPAKTADKVLSASVTTCRVVLDEKGRTLTSRGLAQWISQQENAGRRAVSILIGGANGHSDTVRAAADETWSLSAMTLQHELAFVVLLEQLYRAYSILRGSPYHRD